MHNYKAKLINDIVIKNKVWLKAGTEVNVNAENKESKLVDIVLSKYIKINTPVDNLQEIEGTILIIKE